MSSNDGIFDTFYLQNKQGRHIKEIILVQKILFTKKIIVVNCLRKITVI